MFYIEYYNLIERIERVVYLNSYSVISILARIVVLSIYSTIERYITYNLADSLAISFTNELTRD